MSFKITKMQDLSIADLKAAYDFNEMKIKSLKKSSKKTGAVDFKKSEGYQDLLVYKANLYKELEKRVNSIEVIW
ncbi:hypothetical protein [Flavobacterium sp. SLB02]|jgi:hypothetical protein|uniref:hypothetical protein n=1 Tax=Flavobacterium sp. SLB02 TaxID=2665645 RepID=UPI0012A93157|nr:hypothetical protein [Flavobacterium sp. SLB02]QGK75209.1 hypothetical protein GIY83_14335 [Flavobacterium sp. SLB02]